MKTFACSLIFAVVFGIVVLGKSGDLGSVPAPAAANAHASWEGANAGELAAVKNTAKKITAKIFAATTANDESETCPLQIETCTSENDLFLNSSEKFETFFESFDFNLVSISSDNTSNVSLVLQLPDCPTLRCLHVMLQI